MNEMRQRKFAQQLPDTMQVARDVPKTPMQATGALKLRQASNGGYSVDIVGDKVTVTQSIRSLNELLTFVGDWASGQYNEVKE
jgi:hypothetical protein